MNFKIMKKYKMTILLAVLGSLNLWVLTVGFNWITFFAMIGMFMFAMKFYFDEKGK